MAKACPECGRVNPPSSRRCDCGRLFVSDALIQWVRDSERAGRSQEQLTQELLRSGHALEDVQAALGEAAGGQGRRGDAAPDVGLPTVPPAPTDRRGQPSTGAGVAVGIIAAIVASVVTLLIVVVLVLILAWYLIYGRQPAPTATPIQQPIEELDRPQEEDSGQDQGQIQELEPTWEEESEEEQEQLEERRSSSSPSGLMVPQGPAKSLATTHREHVWQHL
ncbi:MAG: hypothetical protein PVH68_07315 [Armatimonadota bacterium]